MSNQTKRPLELTIKTRRNPEGGISFGYEATELGQFYANGNWIEGEFKFREVQAPDSQALEAKFDEDSAIDNAPTDDTGYSYISEFVDGARWQFEKQAATIEALRVELRMLKTHKSALKAILKSDASERDELLSIIKKQDDVIAGVQCNCTVQDRMSGHVTDCFIPQLEEYRSETTAALAKLGHKLEDVK